jgi:hypothetical protein
MKILCILAILMSLSLLATLGLAQVTLQNGGVIESGVQPIQVWKGQTVTMPQITAMHQLDEDPSDGHLLLLYGTYQIESDSEALHQIHTQTYPSPAVDHTFNNAGTFTYTAVIMYAELQFNYDTGNWETINSGVDTSVTQEYQVSEIQMPDQSFLSSLLATLQNLLCQQFPTMPSCSL